MKMRRLCMAACMVGMSVTALAQPSAVSVQAGGERDVANATGAATDERAPDAGRSAAECGDRNRPCGDSSGASGTAGSRASGGGDEVRGASDAAIGPSDPDRTTSDRSISRTWDGLGSTGGGTGTGVSSGTTADPVPAAGGSR